MKSADDPPRCLTLRDHGWHRARFEAAGRNFEAGDGFFAGHRRRFTAANRGYEGGKLRPQRLGIADGQVAHRIAAVGLEAEALGDLDARDRVAPDSDPGQLG